MSDPKETPPKVDPNKLPDDSNVAENEVHEEKNESGSLSGRSRYSYNSDEDSYEDITSEGSDEDDEDKGHDEDEADKISEVSNEYKTDESEAESDESSCYSDEVYNGPEVRFEGNVIPFYETWDSAGFDIQCTQGIILRPQEPLVVPTNLKVEYITPGYYIAVKGRSGNAMKKNVWVFEGTVDSDYRGIIYVQLCNMKRGTTVHFKKGDRIAQGIVMPHATVFPAKEVERGEGGLGSTGN